MILDVAPMAALLAIGNLMFWRFGPQNGVVIEFGIAAIPVIYVHAFLAASKRRERLDGRAMG